MKFGGVRCLNGRGRFLEWGIGVVCGKGGRKDDGPMGVSIHIGKARKDDGSMCVSIHIGKDVLS